MKKLIAFIICTLLIQLVPSAAMAEEKVAFNESFEGYVTGAFPSSFKTSGAINACVAEGDKNDKELLIVKRAGHAGMVKASFEAITGTYVVSFKVKAEGGAFSGGVKFFGTAIEAPVTFDNNAILTGAGKRYGTLKDNKWTRFDVVMYETEERRSRYDLYIDGVKVLEQWKFESANFKNMAEIRFCTSLTAEDVNFYVDDIYVYSGSSILHDSTFKKKDYNKRSVDFVETDFTMGDSVILKEDFEKGVDATSVSWMGTGNKENYYDEERKSNCMYVNDQSFGQYNLFNQQQSLKVPVNTVYQADVCLISDTGTTEICQFRYMQNTKVMRTAYLYGTGELRLYDNKTILATLNKGMWYTLSFAYDYANRTFDVYVNNRLVKEDVPFHQIDFDTAESTRMLYWTLSDKVQMLVDNMCVYEGDKPREIFSREENAGETPVDISGAFADNSISENLLTGTLAFHVTSGAVWSNNKKSYPEVTAFAENDVFYLPLRTVSEAYGKQIGWDAETASVTVDGVSLKDGMNSVNIQGKIISLTAPVVIRDGVTYIPSELVGKDRLFGVKVLRTDAGVCIIDATEYSKEELVEINRYLVNERPTSQKVKEDYLANKKAGVHPRIFADATRFEELKELVKKEGVHKQWYEKLSAMADKYLKKAVLDSVGNNGSNRTELADRIQVLSLMYRMTGDKKYSDRVYLEMEAATKWPIWEEGLQAGEISYALGLGYDWCYDALTTAQRKYIEEIMSTRSLAYLQNAYAGGSGWTTVESNWNHVSNSGVIAALALTDVYPETCYGIIANCVRSMDFGLETYSPDGQWFEGPGYYVYETEHLVSVLMGLTSVLGTDYRLSRFRGVEHSGDYVLQINGPAGAYQYSDTIGMSYCDAPGLVYFANIFERPELANERIKLMNERGFSPYVIDFVSLKAYGGNAKLPNNAYFRSEYGDLAVIRGDSSDSNSIYLAFRAGKAKVSHGQQEAGSFIFDMNGVRWAEELGREAYSVPGYNSSGSARWTFYKTRSEGHNTIVVNPDENLERNLYGVCYAEKSDLREAGGYTILNLDETYNNRVDGYRRGYMLDDNRQSVVIRDEIDLRGAGEIYWFMQTKAEIEADSSRAILTRDGQQLYMDVIVEGGTYEVLKMEAAPLPTSPNPSAQTDHTKNYSKVGIKVKGNGRVNITVKMYDPRDAEYITPVKSVPLDEWAAPTHELLERPRLDNIFFNGVPAEGFSEDGCTVSYQYDYDGSEPEITTAQADDIGVEIKKSVADENGKTNVDIVAYRKSDRTSFRRYSAVITATPYLRSNLDGYTRYEAFIPAGAADDFKNILDGNLTTNFATQGIGAELGTIDMGESVEIDAIGIGFHDPYNRETVFEISVSNDGVNFEAVCSGKSTRLTDGYEIRKIEPVKARYLKYTGYGSSVGDWNNITELAALKKN